MRNKEPTYVGVFAADSKQAAKEVEVANTFPHVTLLLKNGAKAVESNEVLEKLHGVNADLFKERKERITKVEMVFGKAEFVYVIDKKFVLEGVTGDNFKYGRR
ncbi:unnamed protein product [Sphagnum balticum]